MNRYLRILFLILLASIFAASCVNEMELSEPITDPDVLATFVPRVHSFANEYVTRAEYSENETMITTLSLFVFDGNKKLVSYTEDLGKVSSFQLKKSGLGNDADLEESTVYLLANVDQQSLLTLKDKDLEAFEAASIQIAKENTVITDLSAETFKGFPMMGKINANLSPSRWTQPVLEIPLKILYAKVKFEVSVAQGTENEGSGMQFVMTGYTVNNVAKQTPIKEPAVDTDVSPADHAYLGGDDPFKVKKDGTATMASGETSATKVEFTFYMAETRYSPINPAIGVYPDNAWLNDTEHDHLKQHFKPKLADAEGGFPYDETAGKGLATYVTLQGTYKDYRGEPWNVNYKIYLGKNNFNNFQVDRNSQYTNLICIKGIRNNSEGVSDVWIDHRVDAKTDGAASHVKITRETLIDSHIEVRPLRVQWGKDANGNDKYTGARLYLPTEENGSLATWIGVEVFTGDNCMDHTTYCVNNGVSTGKRRYFTTDLIAKLRASDQVEDEKYILLDNGHCAWIYFDENVTPIDGKYTDREATIKLEFMLPNPKTVEGNTITSEVVEYKVKQNGLASVTLEEGTSAKTYQFESYEEYLHTYDSEDKYNLSTSPIDYTGKGLPWGFRGEDLSGDILVAAMQLDAIRVPLLGTYYIQDILSQRYDYFHVNDQDKKGDGSVNGHYMYTKQLDGSWEDVGNGVNKENPINGSGIIFTDRAAEREFVTVEDMGSMPQNAYQYCLSKNKFTADENDNITMLVHWYLPDAYEMDAILQKSNAVDLNLNANYWTSQPSFSRQGVSQLLQSSALTKWMSDWDIYKDLTVIDEDTDKARAVSKVNRITDIDRGTQNRIRCLYSAEEIEVNLNDRIPDGVNGNYTFIMKGDNANQYFNFLLPEETNSSYQYPISGNQQYSYPDEGWPFPTVEETSISSSKEFYQYLIPAGVKDKDGNEVKGFTINPTESTNWKKYEYAVGGPYYTTLHTYPGLSKYELDRYLQTNSYKPNESKQRKESKSEISGTGFKYESSLGTGLSALDHTVGGNMFNIVFDNAKNSGNPSRFVYDKVLNKTEDIETRYWEVVYPEKTYIVRKPAEDKYYEDTKTETVTAYASDYGGGFATKDRAKAASKKAAEEAALASAENAVIKKMNDDGFQKSDGEKVEHKITSGSYGDVTGSFLSYLCPYTATAYCKYEVKGTEGEETRYYYGDPEVTPWVVETGDLIYTYNQVQSDELRIYLGNSFTISLSDEYKEDYEIVKVKVHLSKHKKIALSGNNNNVIPRFVDGEIGLPITSTGEINLDGYGMTFTENFETSTGSHQWSTSGQGRSSVTMKLVEYYMGINYGTDSYAYQEAQSSQMGYYVVVDRIEVKVRMKTTTATTAQTE